MFRIYILMHNANILMLQSAAIGWAIEPENPREICDLLRSNEKASEQKAVGERVVKRANAGTTFGNRKPRAQCAADFRILKSIPLSI